jgi:Ca-activated chloride channel family protein
MKPSTKQSDNDRAGLFACGAGGAGGAGVDVQRAVPLLGVEVRAEVMAGHARSVLRQRYRNDETKAIEAIYTFPLPTRGSVTGFAMSVNGRQLIGEVHEREEAFRRYDDAMSAGHGSALLEQERPNVFTSSVGNLLPGEETVIEIEYVEPLHGDEGAIRWSLPTLVAPRYMPGNVAGDRTAHGAADPTTRVPDADRIAPPIGATPYGLSLEVVFDLGCDIDVDSPSHDVRSERVAGSSHRTRVTFTQGEVALDRDVVVTAFPKKSAFDAAPIASVVAHRSAGTGAGTSGRAGTGTGSFAVSLVPDLAGGLKRREHRSEVVFVLDRSGSMGGSSITEAKTALRLCLRQLREGDRFAVIAFDDTIDMMSPSMTALTPSTLRAADRWIEAIDARGGTEMLEPLVQAMGLAPSGIIVLLTDGQVGNEDEIQQQLLAKRIAARVYSFGIGTNVSDALLVGLAEKTGGAVEMIHPGERVDDKVVAQFARATAPRVTDVSVSFRGVDVGELAPADHTALVDGEPFTIFGTYEEAGIGAVEIRGMYEGEKFYLEVPIDLPEKEERPAVTKLWAQARIRDLERAALGGRRADAMKDRIVKLAKEHGVSSRYTSFVVVEKRTGDRRVNEQAETRVVPVNAPADWATFNAARRTRSHGSTMAGRGAPTGAAPPMAARGGMAPFIPSAPSVPMAAPRMSNLSLGGAPPGRSAASAPPAQSSSRPAQGAPMAPSARAASNDDYAVSRSVVSSSSCAEADDASVDMGLMPLASTEADATRSATRDPLTALLERQSASGMWEEPGRDPIEATVDALLVLVRLGITTSHPVHGAQAKKAGDALLAALTAAGKLAPKLAELALAALWLLSTGRRTRVAIKDATTARVGLEDLAAVLGRDEDVRAHVERIAGGAPC